MEGQIAKFHPFSSYRIQTGGSDGAGNSSPEDQGKKASVLPLFDPATITEAKCVSLFVTGVTRRIGSSVLSSW